MLPNLNNIMHKPPKLKPLTLSDIMVALINQQYTVDRTHEYKRMAGHRFTSMHNNEYQNQRQQILDLPQFAVRECTGAEIMDYQIRNNVRETQNYENLLQKVDHKIGKAIVEYGGMLDQGQKSIQDLKMTLASACVKVQENRKYIAQCVEKLQKSYSKVGPTLRKINNISKVIEIMSVWGQSKIPYLFSVDIARPYRQNIPLLLQLFNTAKSRLQSNPTLSNSPSLQKIFTSLTQKHTNLITNICKQFTNSVITFNTSQEYRVKYEQYRTIVKQGLCNDVLSGSGIQHVIGLNAKTVYYNILGKLTPNLNVDLLNENVYLDFYDELIQQFVIYFRSWHYITTFHMDNNTPYNTLFLESRKQVFLILSATLSQSIQNSKKFMVLEYKIKLQLVEKLQEYLEAGQKWMGKYQRGLQLPRIVTAKINVEIQGIFGLYNNMVKNVLAQELSVAALESVDTVRPLHQAKIEKDAIEVNYEKITAFLSAGSGQTNKIYSNGKIIFDVLPQPPQVRLKIGEVFIEMISEYLQRSKYLQSSNPSLYLSKIYEHFQFILFMFYQICTRQSLKQKLTTKIPKLMQTQSQTPAPMILGLNSTIKSQQFSTISIKQLNDLSKINILQRKYFSLCEFLISCGTKYDGIKVAGIIDTNKVYESGNQDIITGYNRLIMRIISDLLKIVNWLSQLLPKSHFKMMKECAKIYKLTAILNEIYGLILENNTDNIYKKYIDNLPPIMLKLKWEIKKFNSQTAGLYKEYKIKILEIFRNNTLITMVKSQAPELASLVSDREVQILYRALLECYGRIEKINDNGRQLIRLDCVQISKILNQIGINCEFWSNWFDKYLDFTAERSYRAVLEKLEKVAFMYEVQSWKYQLMWITADLSSKEKKEFNSGLARIYMDYFEK